MPRKVTAVCHVDLIKTHPRVNTSLHEGRSKNPYPLRDDSYSEESEEEGEGCGCDAPQEPAPNPLDCGCDRADNPVGACGAAPHQPGQYLQGFEIDDDEMLADIGHERARSWRPGQFLDEFVVEDDTALSPGTNCGVLIARENNPIAAHPPRRAQNPAAEASFSDFQSNVMGLLQRHASMGHISREAIASLGPEAISVSFVDGLSPEQTARAILADLPTSY
jgi:hypothetical protein